MYQRILVPFDGSKFSKNALNEAIKIAQMTDGIIYLCTVISMGNIVPPGSLLGLVKSASTGDLQRRLIRSAKIQAERLEQSQVSYCKSKGVKAYYKIIVNGNIAEEILKVAKKKAVDLIVIGSQGLQGVSKIKSLGSVSRKVSELASCPVLIVR
ncbi:MAG TPA: universal stress protein [Nitrosopumilaceae archaeon]|nr:universal stress protein [Nitrosopumilaceae archaeon]